MYLTWPESRKEINSFVKSQSCRFVALSGRELYNTFFNLQHTFNVVHFTLWGNSDLQSWPRTLRTFHKMTTGDALFWSGKSLFWFAEPPSPQYNVGIVGLLWVSQHWHCVGVEEGKVDRRTNMLAYCKCKVSQEFWLGLYSIEYNSLWWNYESMKHGSALIRSWIKVKDQIIYSIGSLYCLVDDCIHVLCSHSVNF